MPLGRGGPGLLGTAARSAVAAGVAGRVHHRQQQRWAGAEQQAPATPQAPAAPDYTVELERLAQLRDQGVISAEDFEAKKRQLLGL